MTGAWLGVLVENEMNVLGVKDDRKFEVHCNAGDAGELHVGTKSLSVKVGQRVRRDGSEEMWHSVLIHCDESRQIALIESKPNHNETTRTLTFDLEQKDV